MLSSAKTFFPEIFESLKGCPLWFRALLFILVIAVPLIASIFSFNEFRSLIITPFSVTPLAVAIVLAISGVCFLVFSVVTHKSKHQRQIYQFCELWLEYLPFIYLLTTKIDCHMIEEGGRTFEFIADQKDDFKKFHEWRAKLRELLFKVGEAELYVEDNQHWEKLKKENKLFKGQSYLSPFSFILDQTQPFLLANTHESAAWVSLHISEEILETVAFKHPKLKRLWKKRQKKLEQGENGF
jgi:hypothetical protein